MGVLLTERHMGKRNYGSVGKRNYGSGIIDRRYDSDGSWTGYNGDLPFRVLCHYGNEQYSKCFPDYEEAYNWKMNENEKDRNRDNIGYLKRKDTEKLRQLKVRDVVYNYIHDLNRKLGKSGNDLDDLDTPDVFRLHKFAQSGLGRMSLADVKKHHFVKYFEQRAKETYTNKGWSKEKPVTPRAVGRERNILQRAFQVAIDQNWCDVCHALVNPVKGHKIPGTKHDRNRTLMDGELQALEKACGTIPGQNKYYLPLAIYLAVETGMRAQEIFDLLWSDVDLDRRRIKIRESKIDWKLKEKGKRPGRIIVLPFMSMILLKNRRDHLVTEQRYSDGSLIFPLTRDGKERNKSLLKLFSKIVKKAGLGTYDGETLTFHDLRRTANINFMKAGLDPDQRMLMRGEERPGMDRVYSNPMALEFLLKPIQEQLDRYQLGGTPEELAAKGHKIPELMEWLRTDEGDQGYNSVSFDRLVTQIDTNRHLIQEREKGASDKVTVFRRSQEIDGTKWLGDMTKEAASILMNVPIDELISIDGNIDLNEGWGGIFYSGDYIAVSHNHIDEFKNELTVKESIYWMQRAT
jgi:integrase